MRGVLREAKDGAITAGTMEELSEWGRRLLLPKADGTGIPGLVSGNGTIQERVSDVLSRLGPARGDLTKSAAEAAAAASRYMDRAAALGDETGYRTALAVLRDSARELRALAPALPSARAAEAAEAVWRIADALPEHALTLPEDIAARNGLAERADEEYNETKRSVSADSTEPLTDRRLVSGGIDPESVRAQEHADRFYDEIRHMSTDALHIATNTGFAEDRVVMIKRYLFTDYHDLGGERLQRFDSSFEIAQSWQRLLDGKNIQPHDITLLKHEEMEMRLVNAGLTQAQAHLAASKAYNYAKAAENYYDNTAKHKNG